MNSFTRFVTLGMRDADRRVAAALAPPSLDAVDRYLRQSRLVSTIDRIAMRLHAWWFASEVRARMRDLVVTLRGRGRAEWDQSIATVILTAFVVHLALMLAQAPRSGWFWLVIPTIAAVFGLLFAAASRVVR